MLTRIAWMNPSACWPFTSTRTPFLRSANVSALLASPTNGVAPSPLMRRLPILNWKDAAVPDRVSITPLASASGLPPLSAGGVAPGAGADEEDDADGPVEDVGSVGLPLPPQAAVSAQATRTIANSRR